MMTCVPWPNMLWCDHVMLYKIVVKSNNLWFISFLGLGHKSYAMCERIYRNYLSINDKLIMLQINGNLSCIIHYTMIISYGDLMHICVSCASRYFLNMMSTDTYITTYDFRHLCLSWCYAGPFLRWCSTRTNQAQMVCESAW